MAVGIDAGMLPHHENWRGIRDDEPRRGGRQEDDRDGAMPPLGASRVVGPEWVDPVGRWPRGACARRGSLTAFAVITGPAPLRFGRGGLW